MAAPVRDVTFVSAVHGWALSSGALYETTDGGGRWRRVGLPGSSITHVRFVDATVGYAWGRNARLWLTTDDARTWRRGGLDEVDALEGTTAGVWAINGPQPYAPVRRAVPATTAWVKLGVTPNRTGTLVPHGDVAYVLGEQGAGPVTPSFDVYVGGRLAGARPLPCMHPRRYVPSSPLAVSTDGSLFLVCDVQSASGAGSQLAYVSTDRGSSWARATPPPMSPSGVAAVRGARFAWDTDLWVYRDGHWRLSQRGPAAAPGSDLSGFNVVGFQDDMHGLALTNTGQLYLTSDAGHTWRISRLPSHLPSKVCHASDLRARGGRQGSGFGTAHVDIEISNIAHASCALTSPYALNIIDSTGARLSIETYNLDAAAGAGAVSLRPGARASLPLTWQNWCGHRAGPLTLQIALGDEGRTVTGRFDGPPDYDYWPRCIVRTKHSIMEVLGPYAPM